MSYSMNDYELVFDKANLGIKVEETATNSQAAFLSFGSSPLKLWVENGNYEYTENATATGVVSAFDPDEADISFDGARMGGLGTIHIRDMGRSASEVQFQLDNCAVFLRHISGTKLSIEILSPCGDAECTVVQTGCRTVLD